jgi:uncharacterized protein (TIGR02246 family)
MRTLLITALLLLRHPAPAAADANVDRNAIEGQIDAFIASWNKHDFSNMGNYIADDCQFVNVVGMQWNGLEDIRYAHDYFHRSVFLNTPMNKRGLTIRFLKPDVAIAHLLWHIGLVTNPPVLSTPRTKPDGNYDDLATIVLIKRNGTWLITAMANVVVNQELAPNDPVKLRSPSR